MSVHSLLRARNYYYYLFFLAPRYVQGVVSRTEVTAVFSLFELCYLFAILCTCTAYLGSLWNLVVSQIVLSLLLVWGSLFPVVFIRASSLEQLKSQTFDFGLSRAEIYLFVLQQQTQEREEFALEREERKRKENSKERRRKSEFGAREQESKFELKTLSYRRSN